MEKTKIKKKDHEWPIKKFDPFIFCWLQLCKFDFKAAVNKIQVLGSGCGSVGKVVTSKTEVRGSNPVIGKNYG